MTTPAYQNLESAPAKQVIITSPQQLPVAAVGNSHFVQGYMSRASLGLGLTQLIIGILLAIIGIVSVALQSSLSCGHHIYSCYSEIGCGIMFGVTGVMGIQASSKSRGTIIAFMIMSIISAIIAFCVSLVVSAIDLGLNTSFWYFSESQYSNERQVIAGLAGFALFLSFTEGVIAIISSAICCHGVCCCSRPVQGTVTTTVVNHGQPAYMAPEQQGYGGYYAQPMYQYVQTPPMYSAAPQQQPQLPQGGATGQQAGPLPQKQ